MRFVTLDPALAEVVLTWATSAADVMVFAGPSLPWPPTVADILRVAESERRRAWHLLDGDDPVAFGCYRPVGDTARIGWILTDPGRRGEGWGRAMMTHLIELASRRPETRLITLGVYEPNHAARALYATLGFHETGERTTRQLDGEAWVSLEMALPVAGRVD